MLDIRTEAERALSVGVHEGVLKGNGRMIVGSIAPELYKRIEEYAAKASPAPVAVLSEKVAGKNPALEQIMNSAKAGPATSAPGPNRFFVDRHEGDDRREFRCSGAR